MLGTNLGPQASLGLASWTHWRWEESGMQQDVRSFMGESRTPPTDRGPTSPVSLGGVG